MKKKWYYLFPVIIGLFSLFVYIALYTPSFETVYCVHASLVFFAAMGWSSEILFIEKNKPFIYFLYLGAIIILPFLIVLLSGIKNSLWYILIIAFYLAAVGGLHLFKSIYNKCDTVKEQ